MPLPTDSEFQRLAEEALDHLLTDNLEWSGFEPLLRRSWEVRLPGDEPPLSVANEMKRQIGPIRGMTLKDTKSFSDLRAAIFSLRASVPDADFLVAVNDVPLVTVASPIEPVPEMPALTGSTPTEREWLLTPGDSTMMKVLALWPGLPIGIGATTQVGDTIGHMSLQIPTAPWRRLTARDQANMLEQFVLLGRDQYRLQTRPQDFRHRLSVALVADLTKTDGNHVTFTLGPGPKSNVLAEREIDAT